MPKISKEGFLSLFNYEKYAFSMTKDELTRLGSSLGISVPRYYRKDEVIAYLYEESERRNSLDKLMGLIHDLASEWLRKFEEMGWKEGVQKISKLLEVLKSPEMMKPRTEVSIPDRPPKDLVGEPINFRGFVYAPLNEAGVILLFSKIMDDLGIIYESSPPTFPDLVARRRSAKGYERVYIEFEYKSSNFLLHGHDPNKCDIIVCWEHDWMDCPIEVIELRDVIKRLKK